jgi:parvulin-like peptidyl-prolyl isomerase
METAPGRVGSGLWNPSIVNPRRSQIVCSLGAVVGLAIAGASLFSAHGTTTHALPPEDIASVNQRPILRSDFVTQLESETGEEFSRSTHAEQLRVLDEMVQEELLVQRGLELDFAETDQPTRNALTSAITQQALSEAITSEPTELQLEQYFKQNHDKYSSAGVLEVRDLVLPADADASQAQAIERAEKIRRDLATDAPIEQVIRRFHLVEPKNNGAEFYFVARAHLGDRLFDMVVKLANGSVSKPYADGQVTHVVKVVKNLAPQPLDFARAKPEVLADYKDEQQKRLMRATMTFLRGRSSLLITHEYVDYLDKPVQ